MNKTNPSNFEQSTRLIAAVKSLKRLLKTKIISNITKLIIVQHFHKFSNPTHISFRTNIVFLLYLIWQYQAKTNRSKFHPINFNWNNWTNKKTNKTMSSAPQQRVGEPSNAKAAAGSGKTDAKGQIKRLQRYLFFAIFSILD